MEAYAGMVDRMDVNIGRVLDYLRKTEEYDNTYIFFMSDNGAEGASYEARDVIRAELLGHIHKYYDNSLENIGRYNSFVWYGGRWAQAATAPSRLYKMFSTQGGCRVPLVVKPAVRSALEGTENTSSPRTTDAFCTVMDILPTLLSFAGLNHPSIYNGRAVAPIRGQSWRAFLDAVANSSNTDQDLNSYSIHGEDHATGFEVAGSGALRRGRYKITYVPKPHGPQRWELFDIQKDPGETDDISEQNPELFQELLTLWAKYKEEVGVVGVKGEYENESDNALKDEFEDTGKWIRWLGKEDLPPEVKGKFE
jgi:arylsulfatase